MEQNVKYIDDNRILVREIRGEANFSEIYCSWKDLIENNDFNPSVIGMINDFRGVKLDVKISDIGKIKLLLEDNPQIFKSLKIAVVVNSYKNIVFPMLIEKVSKKANVRPFSTFEAAHDWILGIID